MSINLVDYYLDRRYKKKVVCPFCGQTTELLHQNNFQTVRNLFFGEQSVCLKVNRRRMRCPHCQNKFTEKKNNS